MAPQSFLGQNSNLCHMAERALWVHVMMAVLGKQRCAMSYQKVAIRIFLPFTHSNVYKSQLVLCSVRRGRGKSLNANNSRGIPFLSIIKISKAILFSGALLFLPPMISTPNMVPSVSYGVVDSCIFTNLQIMHGKLLAQLFLCLSAFLPSLMI